MESESFSFLLRKIAELETRLSALEHLEEARQAALQNSPYALFDKMIEEVKASAPANTDDTDTEPEKGRRITAEDTWDSLFKRLQSEATQGETQ